MALQLIGHFDSPFVRRVGVSLHMLGIPFDRSPLSVFGDAAKLRTFNPVGRVPALVLEDGEVLIESAAILDYLDDISGPDRALLPSRGKARRDALQTIALAMGINDKAVSIFYEGRRSAAKVDEAWIARCRSQQETALAALDARFAAGPTSNGRLMQPEITTAAMLGHLRLRQPDLLPPGRHPVLEALSARAEGHPAFKACLPTAEEIGGPPEEARAALLRLQPASASS
jgi:glutathione S-transferase